LRKRLPISRPRTPVLEPVPEQGVSSKFDRNRDGSLILTWPKEDDEYIAVTVRTYDDLKADVKGRIRFLKYNDQRKPPSYFFTTNSGKLKACEFFNSEWYELHHWSEGYRTAKNLKLIEEELWINGLLPEDTSSQGSPPVEPVTLEPETILEPKARAMDSPIDRAMSLLSLEEGLEEHIASTQIAMTQLPGSSSPGLSGPSGTTQTMPTPATQNGMKGTPPSIFNGNKSEYASWKVELRLFQLNNWLHPTMRGVGVSDWVDEQITILDQRTNSLGGHNQQIWDLFEVDMDRAFKDVHTKEQALTKLMDLKMHGTELDAYNVTFNQLVRQCGWKPDEEGTMSKYRHGLAAPLLRDILFKQDKRPNTLRGWQELALKYQGKFLEAQLELGQRGAGRRDSAQLKAYFLKLLNNKKGSHIRPEDRMDIDAVEPVEEKREKRACFYCQKPGHLKKDCQKRLADEAKGKKAAVHIKKAEIVDEDKEDAKNELRKMLQAMGDDEKKSVLSSLVDEHF
jgi:Retrotransposon gag protein/Zinc knuckle